jgi:hypothetical protein
MLSRFKIRVTPLVALLGLMAVLVSASAQNTDKRGRKYKAPPKTARLEVTVVRDVDAKPIENAALVFHPMVNGKNEGNMELKSNEDGKCVIDVLPVGNMVRLQIIAKGFQTYGQDYKIDKDEMALEIRMKRPGEQYSIYKPHHENDKDKQEDKKQDDKPADSKPN